MRWWHWAIKAWIPLCLVTAVAAQTYHRVELHGGSSIQLTDEAFHDLKLSRLPRVDQVLSGTFRGTSVRFAVISKKPLGELPLDLIGLFLNQGDLSYQQIGDATGLKGRDIYRIEGPPEVHDQLCTYRKVSKIGQDSLLFLVGPEAEFYAALNKFQGMADRYQPGVFETSDKGRVHQWQVIGAVWLLGFIVVLIWLVFRRVAVTEEEAKA